MQSAEVKKKLHADLEKGVTQSKHSGRRDLHPNRNRAGSYLSVEPGPCACQGQLSPWDGPCLALCLMPCLLWRPDFVLHECRRQASRDQVRPCMHHWKPLNRPPLHLARPECFTHYQDLEASGQLGSPESQSLTLA